MMEHQKWVLTEARQDPLQIHSGCRANHDFTGDTGKSDRWSYQSKALQNANGIIIVTFPLDTAIQSFKLSLWMLEYIFRRLNSPFSRSAFIEIDKLLHRPHLIQANNHRWMPFQCYPIRIIYPLNTVLINTLSPVYQGIASWKLFRSFN